MPKTVLNMFLACLLATCVILGALAQIAMKIGMNHVGMIDSISELVDLKIILNIITNYYILGGLLLYAISAFLWLGALSTLDVSQMYPSLSLAYVAAALFAFFFLGEAVTLFRWTGIMLIVIGCLFISRS